MSWGWLFVDQAGAAVALAAVAQAAGDAVVGGARTAGAGAQAAGDAAFASQGDAETWLGEHWKVLAAAGVAAATLVEDGRAAYGPLPLAL